MDNKGDLEQKISQKKQELERTKLKIEQMKKDIQKSTNEMSQVKKDEIQSKNEATTAERKADCLYYAEHGEQLVPKSQHKSAAKGCEYESQRTTAKNKAEEAAGLKQKYGNLQSKKVGLDTSLILQGRERDTLVREINDLQQKLDTIPSSSLNFPQASSHGSRSSPSL